MRLHPYSALREAVRRGVAVGSTALVLVAIGSSAIDGVDVGLALLLAPAVALLGAAYGVAYYLRFDYGLDGSTLAIRSGVFGRREREIPLGRVQNVDLRQSLLQRLLGLAQVRIETAGGGETEAVLEVVTMAEAERLRGAIRRRKGDSQAAEASHPGPRALFDIDDVELALYALSSFRPSSLLFLLFAVPAGWETVSSLLLRVAAPLGGPARLDLSALATVGGLVLTVVGLLLAAAATWAVSALLTLLAYHDFALGEVDDDLVYERGLLRRYSGSIPREKVQTLTLVEPIPARWLGYAGLRVETAGYARTGDRGSGRSDAGRPASAVPLATRERALSLARSIESFGAFDLRRPPRVARRRYAVRYLLVVLGMTALGYVIGVALGGIAYWPAPLVLLPIVPVAAHLQWAHRGYATGPTHVVIREGFWRRRTRIVPHYRLQTVAVSRSVFQRRLDIASLVADTASSGSLLGSAAIAHDVATDTAVDLQARLRERLDESLRGGPAVDSAGSD